MKWQLCDNPQLSEDIICVVGQSSPDNLLRVRRIVKPAAVVASRGFSLCASPVPGSLAAVEIAPAERIPMN